ncbi:LOW QUALITY PROTEIN: DBF4-type zinc finger-containing protein 2 [Suncus etruscus]|uniref:LOW QUALITY PROTEIN: DBF4-type zinc finger-containing protein 2 n=1 Tax=Suncus etruscus TaxID=109475 RepID=UPI00210F7250|nr:LOW QUALITY PROTEIN: DBF4-type zinc finger-containing protein 2 [Suncus etruscus]
MPNKNKNGYCSYCCVHYRNMNQHIDSSHHQYLTAWKRQSLGARSLMERFLQDVIYHHPRHAHRRSRSIQNVRQMGAALPSQLVPADVIPEEMNEDDPGVREERPPRSGEPQEELDSRPSQPQESVQNVSIRPSVIQKLEKGQQQPLNLVYKSGDGLKEFNPVGVSQTTKNGQNIVCPSVNSNVPAGHLLESSNGFKSVTTNTTKLLHLESVSKHDPNKADRYFEGQKRGSRNTVLTSAVKISPVLCQKYNESDQKSVSVNSEKLIIQGAIKPSNKTLSTGLKSHESVGAEGFSKYESLSKLAVNPSVNPNKNEMPSQQGIFEDSISKHSGEFSKMYCAQEEELIVVNQSAFLKQKPSAGSEMKFQSGHLQASSDQPEENVPDLKEENKKGQGNNKNALGGSEMSVDYRSSFNVLTDQSEVMTRETNLSKEIDIDLQDTRDESYSFEISSDDFFQLTENQSHADVKDTNIQKAVPISLVDESYNSSDSEMDFDCDASLQLVADCLQKPTEENLSKEVYIGLVDKNYGSSNSEISADSASPLQSVVDQLPVVSLETKPQKYHIYLVDKEYGSSSSEASFDDDISLKSILDLPQLTVKENNLQVVYLEDEDHDPGSAEAHLGCDIALETATDDPQKADKEVNLLEEDGAMEINPCGFQGLKIDVHAHVVADHSQVTLQGVDPQEVAIDLENKDDNSSDSDLSFASNVSLYQSTNDEPQEILSEDSEEEPDIDMEVKSSDCSSSDLTFDSDPPFISATERSELDIAGIMKKYKHLEDKSYGSDSSELTFDSDLSLCSVDQCQVAVYEEKPIDPESQGNKPCVSEINFDSDMPLHSGNDQRAVTLKQILTQKKEYAYSESIHGQPSDFEMQWESSAPSQSVTNLTEVAVKRLDLPKEEQAHSENKEYESSCSELNLDCNSFDAMTEHSEGPIKDVNIQKQKYRHLENKDNEPSTFKIGLKSDDPLGLVTDHLDITAKELNQKEEPTCSEYKNNRLGVSEPSLYPTVSLPSLTHRPGVVVKEIQLQKEKHSSSKDKMAKFSDPEINSDFEAPYCSMNEPHKVVKEINAQKEAPAVSNKSVICRSSKIILDPGVPPQFMTEKPQIAVLQKAHVDVGDELPESRGFEIKFNNKNPFYSVINQSKLTLLKEKYIDLEGTDSESSESNIHFHSTEVLTPLTEQFQEADSQVKPQKADTGFGTRMGEAVDSKLNDSDISFQSVAEQSEVSAKRLKLENQSHVYLGDKIIQYKDPNKNLNSNYLVQSIVGQPPINILGQEQIELEEKHQQFCGSEVSFDSDGPVQLVADQLRETVKEICLWKDAADVEDNTDAHKDLEILYESGSVFTSVSGQPEDIHNGTHLWKKHTDVEDKTVEPRNSEINFASTEPVQFVTNEFQENITELNLRERQVCMDAKGYKLNDSEVIYISSSPLPSITEHRQSLEEAHGSLGEENDDLSGPKIHFAPDNPLESVTDHLQRGVTEICPWKEGHVYLEDTGYRFGSFEVNCDSDTPIHFVTNTSVTTVKEINLQRNVANDLADKNYDPTISEIKCNSGVCLQLKVDEPQLICNEIDLEKEEHGMEEKTGDSEIMCDSDTRLQIVLDQDEVSVRETNLQKMVVMDLVTGDSDCEVISDSETFQPVVIDSPPMTVQGAFCINTEHFDLEGDSQESCVSELRYPCEASGSRTKKSKDTFKVVNQKKDYIILQESSSESYGSEVNFQTDSSPHTITCQTKEPNKKKMKYSDPEGKKRKSKSPKTSDTQEGLSQSVAHQQWKADKGSSFQKDGVNNNRKKNKKRDSSVCRLDCSALLESTHDQNVDKIVTVQLKHLSPEPLSDEPNFQCGSSLTGDPGVNKGDFVKKMCYTLKERKLDSQPSSSSVVDSNKTADPVQNAIEDKSQEPVLEASPHVPASFVGKTLSQIRKEEDLKINALVKEFREGRFHCYFDDDCETHTNKKKKKKPNKGKKVTWADLGQDTASGHILSANDSGVILEVNDFSVAFDKFSHSYPTKMPYDLPWRAASRCQTVKLSHGTQTSLMSHPGKKRLRQAEDSPKRKQSHRKRKKRVEPERLEFPQSCNHVLKPLQPNALLYILSSNVYKVKEEESSNLSTKLPLCLENNGVLRVQYKYKLISFGCCDEQVGVKTPLNTGAPQNEGDIWVNVHFDGSKLKEEDNDDLQNPVKDQLMTQEKEDGDCVSLEKPESLNSNEVPKGSDFQLTLPDGDVTQISPMSAREKNSESKKKIQKRKSAAKMSGYQSRSTPVRPRLSKNPDAGRSKKPKRETQKLLNPVPSGAEKEAADAGSPLK